jgi:hypothetical protein
MRTLAFLGGLGMTIKEAFSHGPERPSLYVLYAGMMGLAVGWGRGERILRSRDVESEDED